jgi:cell division protein FtsA
MIMGVSKNKLVASLDIGSNKIICLIGYINSEKKIYIKGYSQSKSDGIVNGKIIDKEKFTRSVLGAINIAEQLAGVNIKRYFINIKNDLLQSNIIESELNDLKTIRQCDLDGIYGDTLKLLKKNNKELIHIMPLEYLLDNNKVSSPFKIPCSTFKMTFNAVSVSKQHLNILRDVASLLKFNIENFISNGFANSFLLNDLEKENGVLILDIGQTTDISFVYNNKFTFEKIINVGNNHITKDISQVLKVKTDIAEKIKILNVDFGLSKEEEQRFIRLNADEIESIEDIENIKKNVGFVIDIAKARVKEIVEYSFKILESGGYHRDLVKHIVLNGEIALFNDVDNFVESVTNKRTRISYNDINYHNSEDTITIEELRKPTYSVAFGMLNYATTLKKPQSPLFLNILKRIFC